MSGKINLLILPALFPSSHNDSKGIFVVDYIQSVMPYVNVKVFTINLYGKKQGVFNESFNGIEVVRLVLSDKKPSNPLKKLLLYKKFFSQGIAEAGKICSGSALIHVHNSTLYGNIANALSIRYNIPYIITEHTGPFSKISTNRVNRYYAARAWKKCSRLLLVSEDLKKQVIESGMKSPPITITGNPVDTELFSLKKNIQPCNTITFASRLEDYKGGMHSLKAFSKVTSNNPGWKLCIMGDGPQLESLISFSKGTNLNEKVIFTGQFNKQMMKEQFHKSSFFVFPSQHETFGLVLAEAMSCGLPVITGNRTALPEVAGNNAGILVNPESIDDLAAAMEKMIISHAKYNAEKIRESIVSRFSFEVFGKKLNEIYHSVLSG